MTLSTLQRTTPGNDFDLSAWRSREGGALRLLDPALAWRLQSTEEVWSIEAFDGEKTPAAVTWTPRGFTADTGAYSVIAPTIGECLTAYALLSDIIEPVGCLDPEGAPTEWSLGRVHTGAERFGLIGVDRWRSIALCPESLRTAYTGMARSLRAYVLDRSFHQIVAAAMTGTAVARILLAAQERFGVPLGAEAEELRSIARLSARPFHVEVRHGRGVWMRLPDRE